MPGCAECHNLEGTNTVASEVSLGWVGAVSRLLPPLFVSPPTLVDLTGVSALPVPHISESPTSLDFSWVVGFSCHHFFKQVKATVSVSICVPWKQKEKRFLNYIQCCSCPHCFSGPLVGPGPWPTYQSKDPTLFLLGVLQA